MALIESRVRELAQHFDVVECAYNPWSMERSAQLLADEGIEMMVEFPQSNERMSKATTSCPRRFTQNASRTTVTRSFHRTCWPG